MSLQITDGPVVLPVEYVGMVSAILAQRRKGKTYTASVLAEELVKLSLPFVVLDPTGAWWGLRSSADGLRAGLPVRILGGQHEDLPLEREAGRFVADLVLDSPGFYVLDLSLLGSRAAEREFATDFADRLHRRKMQPGMDFPLHLFVDEADMFVPQDREDKGDVRMLGAFQAIVRRGGLHGLGVTLISQRPALVNKSVLTQLDVLILLRLVAGQDQDAVDKSYISRNSTPEQRKEVMASLASMRVGDAWLWEPGADPPLIERVHIRERQTFNSSATPKPGEKRVEPKVWADVELAELKEAMQESIDRAKADDPAELRKLLRQRDREIERLGKELANQPDPEPIVERIEVPVFDPALLVELDEALSRIYAGAGKALEEALTPTFKELLHIRGMTEASRDRQDVSGARPRGRGARPAEGPPSDNGEKSFTGNVTPRRTRDAAERPDPPQRRDAGGPPVQGSSLPAGEAKILAAIAQHPQGCTREQLLVLTGYKRSSRNTFLQHLQQKGLITRQGDRFHATDEGWAVLGDDFERLPTGEELLAHWLSEGELPEGERRILAELSEVFPDGYERAELIEVTGYKKSSVNTFVQHLRARELITVERSAVFASGDLFG